MSPVNSNANTTQTGGPVNGSPVLPATAPAAGLPGFLANPGVIRAAAYVFGALSAALVLLLLRGKRDPETRFHAFQSMFLHGALLVLTSVVGIAGGEIAALARPLFGLASLVIGAVLAYKAYLGEKVVLPIVGPMADRQASSSAAGV
jgi:uncharacterized membrane protein